MENLVGTKFGFLMVEEYLGRIYSGKHTLWKCRCSCLEGNYVNVIGSDLKRGHTKSCGCYRKEVTSARSLKHGFKTKKNRKNSFYKSWSNMKSRCNNENLPHYDYYGGRGIIHDPRWDDFQNFYDDMYLGWLVAKKKEKIKIPTIERIDVNGNYCKENCEWIPKSCQAKNKRNNKWFKAVSPSGEEFVSKNQTEFADEHDLIRSQISSCLHNYYIKFHKGWKFEFVEVKRERKLKRNKLKSI